jgi:hypothetical protein
MLTRLAGRLVTSPVAFLLAGMVDVALVLVMYVRWRLARRRTRRAANRPS